MTRPLIPAPLAVALIILAFFVSILHAGAETVPQLPPTTTTDAWGPKLCTVQVDLNWGAEIKEFTCTVSEYPKALLKKNLDGQMNVERLQGLVYAMKVEGWDLTQTMTTHPIHNYILFFEKK